MINCMNSVSRVNKFKKKNLIEKGFHSAAPRFCYATRGWKVKCSHYGPGVAQRVGRGIALLFHDGGTRRG